MESVRTLTKSQRMAWGKDTMQPRLFSELREQGVKVSEGTPDEDMKQGIDAYLTLADGKEYPTGVMIRQSGTDGLFEMHRGYKNFQDISPLTPPNGSEWVVGPTAFLIVSPDMTNGYLLRAGSARIHAEKVVEKAFKLGWVPGDRKRRVVYVNSVCEVHCLKETGPGDWMYGRYKVVVFIPFSVFEDSADILHKFPLNLH